MSVASALNRASQGLYWLLKGPASSFCRLETADDELTLVSDDGSLVSALEVHGTRSDVPGESLGTMVGILCEKTRALLERPGHHLSLVFGYDPAGAAASVSGCLAPARAAAREMGLGLGGVLGGWARAVSGRCVDERLEVALWTTPAALGEAERRRALKRTAAALPAPAPGRQAEWRAVAELRRSHRAAREILARALAQAGWSASVMTAASIVRGVRLALDPSRTGRDWAPCLPGGPRTFQLPEDGADWRRPLTLPSLASQIFPSDALVVGRDLVLVGRRLHAPFLASIPPRAPRPFSELIRALAACSTKDPLRLSINLSPDGFDGLGLKGALARILSFSSAESRKLAASIAAVRRLAEEGRTVVGLSMAFDTHLDLDGPAEGGPPEWLGAGSDRGGSDWAGSDRNGSDGSASGPGRPGGRGGDGPAVPAAAERFLRARLGRLARLVAGWGQAQVQEAVGDPLLGVCATLPAMTPHGGPAPRAACPLEAAWSFMPARPASPWRTGTLPLRTPDGRLAPFSPMSSLQPAWIDLGLAPMGGGKSVTLNSLNLAFCLQPGLSGPPWLSIIDVGPSSRGLVELLRSALPESRRHLAVHRRLTMDPADSINPFDTPLGCRAPLPGHLSFLVNLLGLLATPLSEQAPPDGIDGLARQTVLAAYGELSDRPRLAASDPDPELLRLARDSGLRLDSKLSWWEVADHLFSKGLVHQASLAQRRAVPTLVDAAAQARLHPGARQAYDFRIGATGESVVDHLWRSLTEAAAAYRCLASPTRFSLGEARVVALDLDEVATRGGGPASERRTAVMYMVARHLAGSRFFLTPSALPSIPEGYREHHRREMESLRRDPKRLCYDELHRVTGLGSLRRQLVGDLETCARESRKWNLSLGLCSQSWTDFPPVVLELATSVFLLGAGTAGGRRDLAGLFGLNPLMEEALGRAGKPSPDGADLVALFRVADGTSQHLLTNTVSPELLWAFSTTSEDMTVRDALYARHGVERTLEVLAARHPGGVKAEAERRPEGRGRDAGAAGGRDVLSGLIEEIGAVITGGGRPRDD